jgi:glycosyltransferase involved in cell wall biosynthesis
MTAQAAASGTLLGIAVPSYKRPDLLARLLDSIDAHWPVVVSDNGAYLDEAFKARHPSVGFVVQPQVVSPASNWNRAAQAIDADWIVMPGDDDLYYPSSFAIIEQAIRANPDAAIFFFGHHIIDECDRITGTWQPPALALASPEGFERVRLGVPARPPGIVFRREVFERLRGFGEEFKVTASDNDFYQRATLLGQTVFVPDVVCGYRVWSSGSTAQAIASREWLDDVDLWSSRVQAFAATDAGYRYPDSLRDEVYMANLRAGVRAAKISRGWAAGWRHAARARYPWRASPVSQFKLLAQLMLPARP